MPRSPITTHVLDTARGRPAVGIEVHLERKRAGGDFEHLAQGRTDPDGRITDLLSGPIEAADYRLRFEVGPYLAQGGIEPFFPSVTIHFRLRQTDEHYHVPLLLSPFGYTTYRGS